jgi:hypothetical protein
MSIVEVELAVVQIGDSQNDMFSVHEVDGTLELVSVNPFGSERPLFEKEYWLKDRCVLYVDHIVNGVIRGLGKIDLPMDSYFTTLIRWNGVWYLSERDPFVSKLTRIPKGVHPRLNGLSRLN